MPDFTLQPPRLSPDGVPIDERREQLARMPAIALSEWARWYGVPLITARKWSAPGGPLHERTWHSGGRDVLIRPDEPVPAHRRPGRRK